MNKVILSIDPSGTGTTGIFIWSNKNYSFDTFQSQQWEGHLEFIIKKIKEWKPSIILFEDTNYIYGRQHQGTVKLYKLIGGIITLKHVFDFVEEIGTVMVSQVKAFRDKVQTRIEEIEGLTYQEGRGHGWKYQGQRISLHEIDALVIYHLWTKEHLPSLEAIETEIITLKAKGKRIGNQQKQRLNKLENLLKIWHRK